jgi:hypothetical protein
MRQMKWRLELRDLKQLTPAMRTLYTDLVASYGGTVRDEKDGGAFVSYRTAEACARNLYCRLGVRTQAIPFPVDFADGKAFRSA